jgi:5,10-methenyltetrahydromethanopterin hydrogenase
MARIMTIGEILVEIMATGRGQSFRAPGTLVGPFPSGAPASSSIRWAGSGVRPASSVA